MKPIHIAIDGIDGCGKSTLCKHAERYLTQLGYNPTILSMLPDGNIRNAIINDRDLTDFERAILLRVEAKKLARKIECLLSEGTSIVCDRSPLSFWAYQYYGLNLGKELNGLTDLIPENLIAQPDGIIYVHVDPSVSTERFKQRAIQNGEELDVFEERHLSIMARVKTGFSTEMEKRWNQIIKPIDGNGDEKSSKLKMIFAIDQIIEDLEFKSNQGIAVETIGGSAFFRL